MHIGIIIQSPDQNKTIHAIDIGAIEQERVYSNGLRESASTFAVDSRSRSSVYINGERERSTHVMVFWIGKEAKHIEFVQE